MKGQYTVESYMIEHGKVGDVFYTEKMDKNMTAQAVYRKRKIKTERLITITKGDELPTVGQITKVTIIR